METELEEAFEHVDIVPDKSEGELVTSALATAAVGAEFVSPPLTLS